MKGQQVYKRVTMNTANLTLTTQEKELLKNSHILIVEDDATNQFVLSYLLEELGCSSNIACNGKKALALFQPSHDIILSDINLPDMTGIEFCTQLRLSYPNLPTPVIAITACATESQHIACRQAGISEVLIKPVLQVELAKTLITYLHP